MQTMGASMQLLRPGERTRAHRHTGNAIYQVARGLRALDHRRPGASTGPSATSSASRRGRGTSTPTPPTADDAVLFSFDDLPVMRKLGFYAEQALEEGGGHQALAPDPSASASPTKRPETA